MFLERLVLEESWQKALSSEFQKPYVQALGNFLEKEKQSKTVYPPEPHWCNAFTFTPLSQVKVVILGQDPYHGPNQAQGLSFSVAPNVPIPPSLQNIYKELHTDLQIPPKTTGSLVPWAQQGVLLLNSVLTVVRGTPGSHRGRGWELFTDKVVHILNQQERPLVFLLWGSYALEKGKQIDTTRHAVFKATHPSPFSAHRGFFGCKHFSKANRFLQAHHRGPIDWSA